MPDLHFIPNPKAKLEVPPGGGVTERINNQRTAGRSIFSGADAPLVLLKGVKILMRESKTPEEFQRKRDKHYPIYETLDLGFIIEKAKKPQRN